MCLLLPGAALQRGLTGTVDAALTLPIGMAWCAGAYWLSLRTGRVEVFWIALLLTAVGFLRGLVGRDRETRTSRAPLALFAILLLALLWNTQYAFDRVDSDGRLLLDPLVTADTAFHAALARELTHTYPPQTPGLAGIPLSYHLGVDLLRAAALRFFGVDPLSSIARLDVTLGAFALALALSALAQRLDFPRPLVALAPFTLFLTDWSFLLGTNPQAHWWADLLRGNVLLSLFYANPIVPALALACACLVAQSRAEAEGSRGLACLAAALAFGVPFFKVFLGAHLAGAFTLAALLSNTSGRARRAAWGPALGAAAGTLLLAWDGARGAVEVSLRPLEVVDTTVRQLGLTPAQTGSFGLFALFWVACSLGVRILALAPAWGALTAGTSVGRATAALALSGWPLGLLLRVSAKSAFGEDPLINDAAFFLEQSGVFLWLFALRPLLGEAPRRQGPGMRTLRWACLLALTTPSTVQYVAKKQALPPDVLPAARVRAAREIQARGKAGDIVMLRPGGRYPAAPALLDAKRVVFERFTPYLSQFADRRLLESRHALVHRFFTTTDAAEARAILATFGASWVCLFDEERLRFEPETLLERVYQEPGATVFRVAGPPSGSRQDDPRP